MPTILITGCSSGFGLEIARYFAAREWDVIATMRTAREEVLPASERIRVLQLDVTSTDSIASAVAAAGPIDALVNNAGIGFLNALEGTPVDAARQIFETNTLGTIAMMQAVLPQMRERRAGVVVNVTSSVTYRPLPLLSVYTASKAAVNAFSDSVALELAPFNVRVRVVLPGRAPATRFGDNARALMTGGFPEAYVPLVEQVMAGWHQDAGPTTSSQDVAEAVWRAVTDTGAPAHLPAGADAVASAQAH
ncbi:SDR family oxidoreductase [Sphingomonas sp. BK580]|uniref:SDR family oxidoreductase n=1 Tax=Sphingomonas sp. BK580 TaxID=2586972 RepID=UPI00160AB5C1|nr:SDR family oxidoreductase [Sphingomonas sp. BK580]MBB3691906.1 NAD(P)-dependent dehydrogenase (short-subunit alcohol dehydrogenase family) [Sphingomonas sp. BK580]